MTVIIAFIRSTLHFQKKNPCTIININNNNNNNNNNNDNMQFLRCSEVSL